MKPPKTEKKTGAQVLWSHGEEAHSGSHAKSYAYWKFSGGGVMLGKGCHPLTGALYLKQVEGKAWEVLVPSSQLAEMKKKHIVGSTVKTGDGVRVRLVADEPPSQNARAMTATFEDAYLYLLNRARNHTAS